MIYGLFPISFSPFTLGREGFSIAQKVPCTEALHRNATILYSLPVIYLVI